MADKQRAERKHFKKGKHGNPHAKRGKYFRSKNEYRTKEWREIKSKTAQCKEKINCEDIGTFSDLPISQRTVKGLIEAGFTKPTEIQKDGIALALRGLDVLGAAKTGSGKTLAFLIPVLELLWRDKWSNDDGLGALIISPTRELALQTYEVLRKVGKFHDFSAGLIIGGKDIDEEKGRILNTNIVICTPGRLLQHFDETPNFQCNDLKILVLDEADRILDLGFANTMNGIIENLPEVRQTLLFSATQTKSLRDLARLSLNKPEYISVHENSKYSTPKKLVQSYVILELKDKINFLFSFIKNHLKSKCIVFVSSCKQVKFLYEVFRKVRPGIPLMALYGKQKQLKRVAIYNRFCGTKHALLFATDIAARGLDFPAVNWVIQFDCPESVDTYIHRAGRTARYEKGGQALLMLLSSESLIVSKLEERKIPVHEIKPNPKKIRSIDGKLQAFCAQDQDIKHWAQRSIISYARSVYLQPDKSIFDVNQLKLDAFARSCGLLAPPKVRFMKKIAKRIGPSAVSSTVSGKFEQKLGIEVLEQSKSDNKDDTDSDNFNVNDDDSEEDDVLVMKTSNFNHDDLEHVDENKEITMRRKRNVSKTALAKKIIRKNIKVNSKITFDEDGKDIAQRSDDEDSPDVSSTEYGGIDVEKAKAHMKTQDRIDREKERKRIKEKHRELKRKEREERQADSAGHTVTLGYQGGDAENEGYEVEDEDENDNVGGNIQKRNSAPPKKKQKCDETVNPKENEDNIHGASASLLEDEELALHLLGAS